MPVIGFLKQYLSITSVWVTLIFRYVNQFGRRYWNGMERWFSEE